MLDMRKDIKMKHSLKLQTETEFQKNLDEDIPDGKGTLKRLLCMKYTHFNKITNTDMFKL